MTFWRNIERKQFSPLYLLYGTETFIINEAKQKIMANVLTSDEAEFNMSTYDLEDTPVELALEDAETVPFIGERKLVIAYNPTFLTSVKQKDKVEHDLKKLEEYLHNPAPYSIVAFIGIYEKLDERKKLTKLLKKQAEILEANQLNGPQLKKWITKRAGELNVVMEEGAGDLLVFLAGNDMMKLNAEISKLALYVGEEKTVTEEDVQLLVTRTFEQNIFTLVDMVVQRKITEAMRIYYDLLKQNEEPIKILALIASQFRLIYQVKELLGRGYGQKQIAGMLKVHPYRVRLAAGHAHSFTDKELETVMNELAKSDLQMKAGGLDQAVIVELFLMGLANKKINK